MAKWPYSSGAWTYVRRVTLQRSAAESPTGLPVCWVCEGFANAVDHVIPVSESPARAFDLDNLRPVCRSCNSRRNAKRQHELERMAREGLHAAAPVRDWGRETPEKPAKTTRRPWDATDPPGRQW